MDENEGGEIPTPADPNDPQQVARYISLYLRNKVLPVRAIQGMTQLAIIFYGNLVTNQKNWAPKHTKATSDVLKLKIDYSKI